MDYKKEGGFFEKLGNFPKTRQALLTIVHCGLQYPGAIVEIQIQNLQRAEHTMRKGDCNNV